MKENKCPKCPACGSPLILSVDTTGVWSRKIKKDGNLHKVINKSFGQPNGASFFECSKYGCGFSYDTEHASHDEPVPELDTWIEEHRNEIW
jgi:hypothetical protein